MAHLEQNLEAKPLDPQSIEFNSPIMDLLPQQCAANSVGAANGLFGLLVQTLMAAHCALAPSDRWPSDYGPTALEKGKKWHMRQLNIIPISIFVSTNRIRRI